MNSAPPGDREFYSTAIRLAAPIALQNLITSGLNLVDTVLIGGLGPAAIAAVGLANVVFFLLNLLVFGVASGCSIFLCQFWGKRDLVNVRRVQGLSLLTNIAFGLVFCLLALALPGQIMSLFSRDPQVILLGSKFLRLIAPTYPMFGISISFAFALRGVGRPSYPMYSSLVAFSLNTLLNYLLIYGRGGFPRLGVSGSALATLIARTVELAMLLLLVYRGRLEPAAKLRELLDIPRDFAKRVYRTAMPVILNEGLWALGIAMYPMIYARIGTDTIAAFNIFATVDRLAMVIFFGLSQACAVMVGQSIGAGDEQTAIRYAKRFSLLNPALGVAIGGILLLLRMLVFSFYRVDPAVISLAVQFLTVYALTIPIRIFNLTNIVGILRSGGDTRFSLFIDTAGLWLLAVPLAALAGLVWHLPAVYVYLIALSEEVFKFALGLWRLISLRWVNNLVHGIKVEPVSEETRGGIAQAGE